MKTTHRHPFPARPLPALLTLLTFCILHSPFFISGAAAQATLPFPYTPAYSYYNIHSFAWAWDGQAWRELPRNGARVLDRPSGQVGKQIIGTLTIDGHFAPPAISGQNLVLAYRSYNDIKTYAGLPQGETGIEVVPLDIATPLGKNHSVRTARLVRQGEASATFGDKRLPVTVQKITNNYGVYHFVYLATPLPAGRYALYLPERAYEFEVK